MPRPDTLQNRLSFTLKMGSAPDKLMQPVWNSAADAAFRYETLARFHDDRALAHKDRAEARAADLRAAGSAGVARGLGEIFVRMVK